jgi:hypothetical protein
MSRTLFFIFLLSWFLSACSASRQKPKITMGNQDERLAGRVEKVIEKSDFVLIRKYGKWSVLDGETVFSKGLARTANLLPTGEELGEHVAADIRSGTVEAGDAVYIRKSQVD